MKSNNDSLIAKGVPIWYVEWEFETDEEIELENIQGIVNFGLCFVQFLCLKFNDEL